MATTKSIVQLVKQDHEQVKQLFDRLDTEPDQDLGDLFCELRETVVRHEVAEELTLYPALREDVPGADAIADARIREQSEAEEKLAELEKMDSTTPEFRSQLVQLRGEVLQHAELEEQEVLPPLEQHATEQRLEEIGERYEKAMASAPTHPHPHAPDTPPGNVVLGPVAAIADRVRDAMRKSA